MSRRSAGLHGGLSLHGLALYGVTGKMTRRLLGVVIAHLDAADVDARHATLLASR